MTRRVAAYLRGGIFADALTTVLEREGFELTCTTEPTEITTRAEQATGCIVDRSLVGADEVLAHLRREHPEVAVAVVGASTASEGLDVVLAILRGDVSSTSARRAGPRRRRARTEHGVARLTVRESQILAGLIAGESTKALAARLGVSPATARAHVQSVLNKLGAHTRLEAVARATRATLTVDDGRHYERSHAG
jgi:two-component system nitrate/nitrite response regulator NarL